MTMPFLGEIQIFGFNFPPASWAFANGATLLIQQNAALYSLIGTTYGGNGSSTYQLPNLVGRAPVNQGQGPALTNRVIGETFGEFTVPQAKAYLARSGIEVRVPFGAPDSNPRKGIPA